MSRLPRGPRNPTVVKTYDELSRFVNAFVQGSFDLMMLIGSPGIQKSRTVREALDGNVCWIEGHTSPIRIYCELWGHRNELVVIDDVDSLYGDRSIIRLLKSLCQSEPRKTVSWQTNASVLERENVPRKFDTTSRVAIIANDWKTLNENVAAIEDRGIVLLFQPDSAEVHRRVATWFWDQEIFDFVGQHLHLVVKPSMRHYKLAWQVKEAKTGLDWRSFLLSQWLSNTALVVAKLKADPSYQSENDRIRAFRANTGKSRATYFNHAQGLKAPIEFPHYVLRTSAPKNQIEQIDILKILRLRQRGENN